MFCGISSELLVRKSRYFVGRLLFSYSVQCRSCLNVLVRVVATKSETLPNYVVLVYTTQVNSTFRARWLASSEVISQVLFTSEQRKKNKMAFVGTLSQIKLLLWPLVIQFVWYIKKKNYSPQCRWKWWIFTSPLARYESLKALAHADNRLLLVVSDEIVQLTINMVNQRINSEV